MIYIVHIFAQKPTKPFSEPGRTNQEEFFANLSPTEGLNAYEFLGSVLEHTSKFTSSWDIGPVNIRVSQPPQTLATNCYLKELNLNNFISIEEIRTPQMSGRPLEGECILVIRRQTQPKIWQAYTHVYV